MTKRNPYLQHTYESFDQPVPPRRPPQEPGFAERILGSDMLDRVRSPLFATAALLLTGAAFAGIIIASYPDSQQVDEAIPVISADASPLRESPTDPGGMDVAHEDSTIYSSIRSAELQETAPIENLLAEEKPVDTQTLAGAEPAPPSASALEPAPAVTADATATTETSPPPSEMADATAATEAVKETGAIKTEEVKTAEAKAVETKSIPLKAQAAPAAEKPAMPAAASNPETLAYVRSVLDNKGAPTPAPTETAAAEPAAEAVATIEPASGAATSAGSVIKPGSTYVQLASISAESAAPKEWAKLQKAHSSLSGADYRVQRADLGAKGVFFRIQAGPMSKDSAKSVCEAIKAQKPGGCIIVQ